MAYGRQDLKGSLDVTNFRLSQILNCAENIGLGEALGQLYMEQLPNFLGTDSQTVRNRVGGMIDDLKSALREAIRNSDWMSPVTKVTAEEKLDRMRVRIGYPDRLRDYSGLRLAENLPFVRKILATSAYQTECELSKVGRPINDLAEWPDRMPLYSANASYTRCGNELIVCAGIFALLDPELTDGLVDDAVKYARLTIPACLEIAFQSSLF